MLNKKLLLLVLLLLTLCSPLLGQKLMIPMDQTQNDHLKAYGVAYWVLTQGVKVEWLLNYRAGSFLMDDFEGLRNICVLRGVTFEPVDPISETAIRQTIEANNMESVLLEKAPAVVIYSPPNKEPWDDAVTLALTYAEIDYETVWDAEVLDGQLEKYDWLHLHH
ncbi:MAG: asparagine synthetase B, partial [bacterium]